VADEDVELAEVDLLDLVEVSGRAEHHEQRVPVSVRLGPLVGDDGVLDRQLVQVELLRDVEDHRVLGPVEADPGHAARGALQAFEGFAQRLGGGGPAAVHVDRVVDDVRPGRDRFVVRGTGVHRPLGRVPDDAGTSANQAPQATHSPIGHTLLLIGSS
jgi:hypothetical protein